jgi:hypothetical protein
MSCVNVFIRINPVVILFTGNTAGINYPRGYKKISTQQFSGNVRLNNNFFLVIFAFSTSVAHGCKVDGFFIDCHRWFYFDCIFLLCRIIG